MSEVAFEGRIRSCGATRRIPQRYVVVTTVEQDGKQVDRYETPFGVRTTEFTATNGFLLNGQRVPINGVCDHADLGALGSAVNTRGLERQIEILKEMGCNAIRTSHNPPAPELLDLCDKMGILVMDESFDCWRRQKTANDYHRLFDDWHEKDWRAELRRDRNHPSIILWSIGNEIPEQSRPEGRTIAAELSRIAHEEDPTRPTTSPRATTPQYRVTTASARTWMCSVTITNPLNTAESTRRIRRSRFTAARRLRASVRAGNIFSR